MWKISWSVLVILGACYFVRSLVQFVTIPNPNKPGSGNMYNKNTLGVNVGWILSTMFFVDSIFVGIALQRMGDACVRCGIKIRSAVMTAVYTKTFCTAGVSDQNVVSLVATDCTKLYEGVTHVQNVWTAPLEATAIIALLLWLTDGIYGLPALGVLFFILPLQFYLGWRIAKFKLETVEVSDARVHRMHEVLLAVKLVKFYVWEKSFAQQVTDVSGRALQPQPAAGSRQGQPRPRPARGCRRPASMHCRPPWGGWAGSGQMTARCAVWIQLRRCHAAMTPVA